MLQYIMMGIAFITLYFSILWLSFFYICDMKPKTKARYLRSINIVVPAYNEEDNIIGTIESLLRLNYPKDKIKITVVDDGSQDNTKKVVERFISEKKPKNVFLISQKNKGKASALNNALKKTDTELFACVDADSFVDPDSLRIMVDYFEDKKVGAVIPSIKVYQPRNLIEKLQDLEYNLAVFARKVFATIGSLFITPGVLSVYRTDIIKRLGGFDEDNLTEDFEIAMRLKYNNYLIEMDPDAVTYTKVPKTFKSFWRQRIRWFRGFYYNNLKYRKMFFSRDHDLIFSWFQLPLNIFAVFMLFFSVGVIAYSSIKYLYETLFRILTIPGYLSRLIYLPDFENIILGYNVKVMFPIIIGTVAMLVMIWISYKLVREKIRHPVSIWVYIMFMPYLLLLQWAASLAQEILKFKKKW